MKAVKRLVEAGSPIPGAIKTALGMPITEFADKYDLPRGTTSEVVNGSRKPSDEQLKALIAELGGSREEWLWLLWEAGKPDVPRPERALASR